MSKKFPWFRMYADFLNDPKMIGLAFEDQRHFIGVLALKSDGAIDDVADGDLLDRIVAQRLWIDHAIIRDVKRRLVAAGLIDANWQPLAWDKRQFVSDRDGTATERKRRERAAKASAKSVDKSTQNDDVTDVSRVTSRTGHGNVTRLDTDTDTDTDKDKEDSYESLSPGFPDDDAAKPEKKPEVVKTAKPAKISKPDEVADQVWADFLQVRKAKRSPLTATALAGIEREAAKAGIGLQQALEVCCESGWVGFKADWYANRTAQDALRRTSRAGNTHKHAAAGATIFEGVWDA